MKSFIGWLFNNKEWLFSGLFVSIITAFFSYPRLNKKQKGNSVAKNNNNIKIGGYAKNNVIIYNIYNGPFLFFKYFVVILILVFTMIFLIYYEKVNYRDIGTNAKIMHEIIDESNTVEPSTEEHNMILSSEQEIKNNVFIEDFLIEWEDKMLEKLIKSFLNKDEVYYSDVKDISALFIYGEDMIFLNEVPINDHMALSDVFIDRDKKVFTPRGKSPHKFGKIGTLDDLKYFSSLKILEISYMTSINTSFLENAVLQENLTALTLAHCNLYNEDIYGIELFKNLNSLDLTCNNISDIILLENLEELTSLCLSMNSIENIEPLRNLTKLEYLFLNENNIIDISALSELENLEEVGVLGNAIKDYTPLEIN